MVSLLRWLGLIAAVLMGMLGTAAMKNPASGTVAAPIVLWVLSRHGLTGLRILWRALNQRLPVDTLPTALEVITDARHAGVWAGGMVSLVSVLLMMAGTTVEVGFWALLTACAPLLIGVGLSMLLWRPMERNIQQELAAWQAALHEALHPACASQCTPQISTPCSPPCLSAVVRVPAVGVPVVERDYRGQPCIA